MQKILPEITQPKFILILIAALIAGVIATVLALNIAKIFSKIITRINYRRLCIFIIIFITALVIILTGPLGLFILIVSTSVGMLPNLLGIEKNHLMGSLIVPVLLFFLL
jgi:putative membrane protein